MGGTERRAADGHDPLDDTTAESGVGPHATPASAARPRSRAAQDLSQDEALRGSATVMFEGEPRPAIGGIPLLARLGRGGMGVVYYGVHPRLRSEVAIKTLPRFLEEKHEGFVDRFVREAQLAARIRSDHLVGVLDVDKDAATGCRFIVMEYVRGGTAASWAQSETSAGRAVRETDALDVCIAATRGLTAAHLEGVVHRDVKPDNIFLPRTGDGAYQFTRAKLGDLGLARPSDDQSSLTTPQLTLGTPGYMPPEQIGDARGARKPADTFSMGATLYSLLAGRAPFSAPTAIEAIIATREAKHRPLREARPDVSPATAEIVARCLAKDPKHRFPDAPALLDALQLARTGLSDVPTVAADLSVKIAELAERTERGRRVESAQLAADAAAADVPVPSSAVKTQISATPPSAAGVPTATEAPPSPPSRSPVVLKVAVAGVAVAAVGVCLWLFRGGGTKTEPTDVPIVDAFQVKPAPPPAPAKEPDPAATPPKKTDELVAPKDPVVPAPPAPQEPSPPPAPAVREDPAPPPPPPPVEDPSARAKETLQRAKEDLVAGRLADALRGFDSVKDDAATADGARRGRDDVVRAYLVLAAAKEEAGVHTEAVAAYESALRALDPARALDDVDVFDARTRLADALIGADETQRAVAALDAISAEQRNRPLVKALRAKCALAEAGGSEWPQGAVAAMFDDASAKVALKRLSDRFLAQAKREHRLGLAWETLLDAQVAASLAPTSVEPEFYVGAALAARHAAGKSRPGDEKKARTWLTSFVKRVDGLGAGASAELTSLRAEAARVLETLPK
jgi:serine/threonine protein kinase